MARFDKDIYLAAGLRTPFSRAGSALATYDALTLSVPVVQAMVKQLAKQRSDLVLLGNGHSQSRLEQSCARNLDGRKARRDCSGLFRCSCLLNQFDCGLFRKPA